MKKCLIFLFLTFAGLSDMAAYESFFLPERSHLEWQQQLARNKNAAYRESLVYSKFDTYSRFFKEDMTDTEIMIKYGLGWRYRKAHHGFNISISGHEPREFVIKDLNFTNTIDTDTGDVIVIRDKSISGSYYYVNGQAMYLYYLNPKSSNSFYFGAGAEADRYTFHLKNSGSDLDMGFVSGVLSGGYQFQVTDKIKSFVEMQVSQPAFIYGSTQGNRTGLIPMNSWAPSVTFSIGIGF